MFVHVFLQFVIYHVVIALLGWGQQPQVPAPVHVYNHRNVGGSELIGTACLVGTGACMRSGSWITQSNILTCSAFPGRAQPEVVDGVDNDCDGLVDDVPPRSCYRGPPVGICEPGRGPECIGEIRPRTEIPGNGIDEDCNGADAPF